MPKSTVSEESPYAIPEDTLLPLQLQSVEYVEVPYVVKSGRNAGTQSVFRKWEWTFQVTDGEYAGLDVRGNSEPKVTSQEEQSGNLALARPWVEALLGRELALGEEVDTDDLIGLAATGTVRHLEPRPKKDGNGHWFNHELDELFPKEMATGRTTGAKAGDPWGGMQEQPPF